MELTFILVIGLPVAIMGLLLWSCVAIAGSADRRINECREEWLRQKHGEPVNLRFTVYDLRAEGEISDYSPFPPAAS